MKAVVRLVYRSSSKWSLCGLGSVKSPGVYVYLFVLCSVPLAGRALFGWTKLWRDLVSIKIIVGTNIQLSL